MTSKEKEFLNECEENNIGLVLDEKSTAVLESIHKRYFPNYKYDAVTHYSLISEKYNDFDGRKAPKTHSKLQRYSKFPKQEAVCIMVLIFATLFLICGLGIVFDDGGSAMLLVLSAIVVTITSIILAYFVRSEKADVRSLYESHYSHIRYHESLSKLLGDDRARFFYEVHKREYDNRPSDIAKLAYAMNSSVYQEREHDWAVIGGIGGVGAAIDAQIDNVRIRAENEARKSAMKQTTDAISRSLLQAHLNAPVPTMENYKYDFETDQEILAKTIEIKYDKIKLSSNIYHGKRTVEIPWEKVGGPDIDGYLICELYSECRFVGECKVNFEEGGSRKGSGTFVGKFSDIELPGSCYVHVRIGRIYGIK